MDNTEKSLRIKNLLRLFLQGIRDYEKESGTTIAYDERDDLEFVEIFLNSDDGFEYERLMKDK